MEKLGFRFSEKIAIIKAPSVLGLTKTGVEGLADQFFARDAGTVTPPKHSPSREQQTGFINAQAIAQYSKELADAISEVLDADVLSDSIMPTVDYRLPDGLFWEELVTMLQVTLSSSRVVGIEVTIYNSFLDQERCMHLNLLRQSNVASK